MADEHDQAADTTATLERDITTLMAMRDPRTHDTLELRLGLLLTSRKAVQLADFSPHIVSCSELSVAEAAALLKQMAPGTPKQHSETIAELCGCMPLALRLCGCALGSNRVKSSPDDLIRQLQSEKRRMTSLGELADEAGQSSVDACIMTSYSKMPAHLQLVFLALSTFPAHFDDAAAAALLSGDEPPVEVMTIA